MKGPHRLPPHLFLMIDHETVTGVEGDARDLIPPMAADTLGTGLLDFVHPVDRAAVAAWLDEGLGASPPFRRAAADDPPRWFRFMTADTAPGSRRGRILFVDVTPEVRQEALRQRLNSVLARYVGRPLVERAPELAAELAGAGHGCLTELYPPVAVVRASYGSGMPEPGTTMPIEGTPLEEMVSSRTMKVLNATLRAAYPAWSLIRFVQAESAILVPVVDPATAQTRAVLTCCSPTPFELEPVEEELLDLLAMRLSSELGTRPATGANGGTSLEEVAGVDDDMLGGLVSMMALDGVIHTLNNLFASQMLHLDLAAAELATGTPVAKRLERVTAEAVRGAAIIEGLGVLAHDDPQAWREVDLGRSVREAVEVVETIHGAADIALDGDRTGLALWIEQRTFMRTLIGLLVACVTIAGEAGTVRVTIRENGTGNDEEPSALVTIVATSGAPGTESRRLARRASERLRLGLGVAKRLSGRFGGRVTYRRSDTTVTIGLSLPVHRPPQQDTLPEPPLQPE